MPGIFISYRNIHRSYAPMFIDRELSRRFGADNVFQAGRSVLPAASIPGDVTGWLEKCTVLIALIDLYWVSQDLSRLWDPEDWVRREISHALEHGKTVLPVLLDGAEMPKTGDVPDVIAPLTKLLALRMRALTADTDLVRLIGEVERLAPDLVLATLTNLPASRPPSGAAMLRAENELYPYRYPPEFDELVDWATSRAASPVLLVTGPGAVGKTRLWEVATAGPAADPLARMVSLHEVMHAPMADTADSCGNGHDSHRPQPVRSFRALGKPWTADQVHHNRGPFRNGQQEMSRPIPSSFSDGDGRSWRRKIQTSITSAPWTI